MANLKSGAALLQAASCPTEEEGEGHLQGLKIGRMRKSFKLRYEFGLKTNTLQRIVHRSQKSRPTATQTNSSKISK
jgi:hypothetical protein